MSAVTVLFLFFVFGLLAFLSDVTSAGTDPTHASYFGALFDIEVATFRETPVGVPVPTVDVSWLGALWGIGTWDYWFLSDNQIGRWIRLLVFYPITSLLAYGIVTTVGPALAQIAQVSITAFTALAGGIGSLFGLRGPRL